MFTFDNTQPTVHQVLGYSSSKETLDAANAVLQTHLSTLDLEYYCKLPDSVDVRIALLLRAYYKVPTSLFVEQLLILMTATTGTVSHTDTITGIIKHIAENYTTQQVVYTYVTLLYRNNVSSRSLWDRILDVFVPNRAQ